VRGLGCNTLAYSTKAWQIKTLQNPVKGVFSVAGYPGVVTPGGAKLNFIYFLFTSQICDTVLQKPRLVTYYLLLI
jgi:hypothetical protein